MGYEIDYLPVGQKAEDKSGDAIAMRFWDDTPDKSLVVTIDGGTRESGEALVKHVKKYYKTTNVVIAVLTHPDADHASGLRDVLEKLQVGALLAFVPWEHASDILPIVQQADSRVTAVSIAKRLKEAFPAAVEAIDLARENGVKVFEPFATNDPIDLTEKTRLFLLGPTREAYLSKWLPYYDCLPTKDRREESIIDVLVRKTAKAIKWVAETWDRELLVDPGEDEVNAENNSSTVIAVTQETKRFLFAGDAGVPALVDALNHGSTLGLAVDGYTFFHVPHHGSRHNIGPALLNVMFGKPRHNPDSAKNITAFVSATKDDPKHPSRRVTNALNRRAIRVIATAGSTKLHHSSDYIDRGWSKADPIPFFSRVEDVDGE